MSKRYSHYRADLADEAALQAAADANPASYPVASQYTVADGTIHQVLTNDGTTVVLVTFTVS